MDAKAAHEIEAQLDHLTDEVQRIMALFPKDSGVHLVLENAASSLRSVANHVAAMPTEEEEDDG